MQRATRSGRWMTAGALTAFVCAGVLVACSDDEATGPELPGAPAVQVATNADTVTVSWSSVTGATAYRVELTGNPSSLMQNVSSDVNQAMFTGTMGLEDDVTYTVVVYAINANGETASTTQPTVLTNYFPWDENFATSLHATGQGKITWYGETPNGGFQRFTNIEYSDLSCKGCHEPSLTGGCEACHDTATPALGAEVDASLTGACGACHGRQKAEALMHGYSDVHRDAGMDCMDCHSMEDVHGDGTAYSSMLDDGAIDADCGDCHTELATNQYHSIHETTVDCTACHVQSVVSCYNCHFETEVELDVKKAYGQFKDWVFLVNRDDKVHAANFQSVKYGDDTFVAMAPFYAHTIARNARTCDDCHNSAAVADWTADGVMDVVTWDGTAGKLNHVEGVVPVPPDYLTSLRFDFVDLDQPGGSVWSFLKTGADTIQLLFAEPLTQEQMNKLQP